MDSKLPIRQHCVQVSLLLPSILELFYYKYLKKFTAEREPLDVLSYGHTHPEDEITTMSQNHICALLFYRRWVRFFFF
jgi:hypothetical protein